MSNQTKKKYHLRKRAFLSREAETPDYIVAIVEDTKNIPDDEENEDWKWSHVELLLGNSYDQISINFSLENWEERTESLSKVRQLSKIISQFRDALEAEIKSMNARTSQKKQRGTNSKIIEISTVA